MPRIASRRLLSRLLWALLLPVAAAFAADAALDTAPLLAVVATVVCIPLATLLVSRAALVELNKVIQQVAPAEVAPGEPAETGADALREGQQAEHPPKQASA